jgi:hypothetical protein
VDTIILTGVPSSKKNSKRIFTNKITGKPFITSSEGHGIWHKGAVLEVRSWRNKQSAAVRNHLPLKSAYVEIYIFAATSHRFDLTNKAESVMDLLVDEKILKDDSWDCVPELRLLFGGIDKNNPRAEVFIVNNNAVV